MTAAVPWAMAQPVNDHRKLLLVALTRVADAEGATIRSQTTLAAHANKSTRRVRSLLRALEADGLITRWPRARKNGSRTSDLIAVNFPRDTPFDPTAYSTPTATVRGVRKPRRFNVLAAYFARLTKRKCPGHTEKQQRLGTTAAEGPFSLERSCRARGTEPLNGGKAGASRASPLPDAKDLASAWPCALCDQPLPDRAWWTIDHRAICPGCEIDARVMGIIVPGSLLVATAPAVRP